MASVLNSLCVSIHYRLLQILLQQGFWIQRTNFPLSLQPTVAGTVPPNSFAAGGYSWNFFSPSNDFSVTSDNVMVYVGGVLQPPSSYRVDYTRGMVIFSSKQTQPVTASFQEFTANVREAFQDDKELFTFLEKRDIPLITWNFERQVGQAFSVGSSIENRRRYFTLTVLAINDTQLRDLGDIISRFIVSLYLWDMGTYQPLDYQGGINASWNLMGMQIISPMRWPVRPEFRTVTPAAGASDKLKFQGKIVLMTENID